MKIALALTFLLAGCLSPQKMDRQLAKINKKKPEKISGFCSSQYPCATTKADTLYRDSLISIIDSLLVIDSASSHDTTIVYKVGVRKLYYKVQLPQITKYIEDSAKLYSLKAENESLRNKLKSLDKGVIKANVKFWGFLNLLALLIIGIIFRKLKKNEDTSRK